VEPPPRKSPTSTASRDLAAEAVRAMADVTTADATAAGEAAADTDVAAVAEAGAAAGLDGR